MGETVLYYAARVNDALHQVPDSQITAVMPSLTTVVLCSDTACQYEIEPLSQTCYYMTSRPWGLRISKQPAHILRVMAVYSECMQSETDFVRVISHPVCTYYMVNIPTRYLFGIDGIGLSQQKKILRVEGHKQSTIHIEVPKLGGEALEPTTPDENHDLQHHIVVQESAEHNTTATMIPNQQKSRQYRRQ